MSKESLFWIKLQEFMGSEDEDYCWEQLFSTESSQALSLQGAAFSSGDGKGRGLPLENKPPKWMNHYK